MLRRPEPVLAEHADAVRVVDDHDRVVLLRELDELGQPRQVALHREDAVGDHELPLPRLAGRELARGAPRGRSGGRPPCGAGFASRIASTIEAWLSASERITVLASVSVGMSASFAFQQET